jgi:hypothetical protein
MLLSFPKLQRIAIQHKRYVFSLDDDDNTSPWTFPKIGTLMMGTVVIFRKKKHPSLTVVWLGIGIFWRWEETMWKMYRCRLF